MKQIFALLLFLCFLLPYATAQANEPATIYLPESTIAKALTKALPYKYVHDKGRLRGDLTILKIQNLSIEQDYIRCKVLLQGDQLRAATKIGGQTLHIDLGTMQVPFNTKASLRLDRKKQTLYIKPTVDKSGNGGKKLEFGDLLIQAVNGREIPIKLKELKPIVADTGSGELQIGLRFIDISAQKKRLRLLLEPQISKK